MKKGIFTKVVTILLAIVFVFSFAGCDKPEEEENHENKTNNYAGYNVGQQKENGMDWPEGQVLPTMAKIAETLDSIRVSHLTNSEMITFSYLQGLVNKEKPRMFLYPSTADEGVTTWPKNLELNLNNIAKEDRYSVFTKYKDCYSGIVLYDRKTQGDHYINLACTVASIEGAIPVDVTVIDKMTEAGFEVPKVVKDLTSLEYKGPVEIYTYMYETYWKDCNHRLLFSLSPSLHKYYVRDMAAATGGAII